MTINPSLSMRLMFILIVGFVTSGSQFALGFHLGKPILAIILIAIASTQVLIIVRSFRIRVMHDKKSLEQVKSPQGFIRSIYVNCAGYLFFTALLESFLVGRASFPASSLTPYMFEAWIGHLGLVSSGILRYWGLSLGHSASSAVRHE